MKKCIIVSLVLIFMNSSLMACPPVSLQSAAVGSCGVVTTQAIAVPVVPQAVFVPSVVVQHVATPVVVQQQVVKQQIVRQRVVQPRSVVRTRSVSRVGGLGIF